MRLAVAAKYFCLEPSRKTQSSDREFFGQGDFCVCYLAFFLASLVLGIVRVGFYFQDLFGVAFAVSGDKKNKLISIQLRP